MNHPAKTIDEVIDMAEGKVLLSAQTDIALLALRNEGFRVKTGTAKKWFQAHHGAVVDTVMAQPGSVWVPRDRTIDALSRATEVALDGSWRSYAGLTVLHADENNLLIGYDFNGPSWALYVVA